MNDHLEAARAALRAWNKKLADPFNYWRASLIVIAGLFLALALTFLAGRVFGAEPEWIDDGGPILRAEVAYPQLLDVEAKLRESCLLRGGVFGATTHFEKQRVLMHCTLPEAPDGESKESSLPAVIFRGEKSVQEWFAPYPSDPSKTLADVTAETCAGEHGFLVVTEHDGLVSFTCIRRADAPQNAVAQGLNWSLNQWAYSIIY